MLRTERRYEPATGAAWQTARVSGPPRRSMSEGGSLEFRPGTRCSSLRAAPKAALFQSVDPAGAPG